MQWITWWPGDYLRDTGDLSLIEHGAYRVLLDHYYSTDGRLRADQAALYRICRAMTEEEQAAVGKVVRLFFTVDGDGWLRNKKADKVMAEAASFIEAKREAGKMGAARRWHGTPNGTANGTPNGGANGKRYGKTIASTPTPTTNTNTKTDGVPPSDKDFIFGNGVRCLVERGMTREAAASVLGKMVKEFGEHPTADALAASLDKAAPHTYALAMLKKAKSAQSGPDLGEFVHG